MSDPTLRAEPRTITGGRVRRLRRLGQVPAVLYGPTVAQPLVISVDRHEFERCYRRAGHATVVRVEANGRVHAALIREVQLDGASRQPIHVRFFAPRLDQPVRTKVAVALTNPDSHAQGVLTQLLDEIEVEGLPGRIPHQITVDLSGLHEAGDVVRVGGVSLPEGIAAVTGGDEVIVQLAAERVAEVEVEAVEAEPEAAVPAEPAAEAAAKAPPDAVESEHPSPDGA
jgi:large subunit ribosomal protein L25